MEYSKIVLEYIKTLIWPIILIVAFFSYEDEMLDLLKNREIDAFGLKIGKNIDVISTAYSTEINALKQSIVDAGGNEELLNKIADIDKNIKKELSAVKQQTESPQLIEPKAVSRSQVSVIEREGFEAIVNQDVTLAIQKFSAASELWSDYHNVSEIKRLLIRQQSGLNSPEAWLALNRTILEKYSWGMPSDIRAQFTRSLSVLSSELE